MSLDVYLKYPGKSFLNTGSGIFIRRNGSTIEITRKEWDSLHPGREPLVFKDDSQKDYVFHYNITHNLGAMAKEADIYEALWRPEELGLMYAKELIKYLEVGANKLVANSLHYKKFNPANGWGDYNVLLQFVLSYLVACKEYPDALIEAER